MDYFSQKIYFVVSDTQPQNTPRTRAEFLSRCHEIEALLPAQGNNVAFVEAIFTFFRDCGLITRDNIELLSDKYRCNRTFSCNMNPLGGVLRREGLPMSTGRTLRYYCTKNRGRAVICQGEVYYISNDWYAMSAARPTKNIFYDWVLQKAYAKFAFV